MKTDEYLFITSRQTEGPIYLQYWSVILCPLEDSITIVKTDCNFPLTFSWWIIQIAISELHTTIPRPLKNNTSSHHLEKIFSATPKI